ncbi:hypothetical protein M9H77_03990 [Catharanthus roseus]|uniref:Uncharacterized protein n=1 Tax=Catharanthus roseus TaxID=4058 RepID=A0ACC0CCU1_CATRO|nr:hypothetical protein M9H77_03990 [Catharanthus roseus]
MEEVPAHVHPGPIATDVLSRQHEHRTGLIWSRDRETCYTNLQCRRFGCKLFQCYSAAPRRLPLFRLQSEEGTIGSMDLRAFIGSETEDDLILRARSCARRLLEVHDRLEGLWCYFRYGRGRVYLHCGLS